MGPLTGIRILELDAIGPAPLCAMLLADLGATVLRVARPGAEALLPIPPGRDVVARGRPSITLDLKSAEGLETLLGLAAHADALIEGSRPGVAERLGFGPGACLARNPRLVYGRVTGWGQTGPLAQAAGHDITYLAVTGVLDAIGRPGQAPAVPLNLIGDYAGGTMFLAMGVLAGLLHARATGEGQVVDAAMTDGVAALASLFHGLRAAGAWGGGRGENLLDGGAPFYDVYETADGKHVALGALEPKFFAAFAARVGLDPALVAARDDRARWPELRAAIAAVFRGRARDEWTALLEATDACVAGVLTFAEAPTHPHAVARRQYADRDGVTHPAPAPRFSATPGEAPSVSLEETLRAFGHPPAHGLT